jgi:protein-S-isoprenylcysteine O-methyltransferase Ste14
LNDQEKTEPEKGAHGRVAWTYFFSGNALYLLGLSIYSFSPYYRGFIAREPFDYAVFPEAVRPFFKVLFTVIGQNTHELIWRLYLLYLVYAIFNMIFRSRRMDLDRYRPYVFWRVLGSALSAGLPFLKGDIEKSNPPFKWTPQERTTVLYFLLKLFYVPVMTNFLFSNIKLLFENYNRIMLVGITLPQIVEATYFSILYVLLIVDTGYFTFGYLFEIKGKSEFRSVDPYFTGWLAALMCYPPFNGITCQILGWGSTDYATFNSLPATMVLLGSVLFLYFVYTWASVALGPKASNLTNRGIVSWGPYRFIRHPAYACKNLAWIVMAIPIMKNGLQVILPLILWSLVYFFRALTEERHLMADPDYREYCRKVRYRFIPGLY